MDDEEALLRLVAREIGYGLRMADQGRAWMLGPEGAYLRVRWGTREIPFGQAEVSGEFTNIPGYRSDLYGRGPRIYVSMTKGHDHIAKEITRRLVPAYERRRKALTTEILRKEQHERARIQTLEGLQEEFSENTRITGTPEYLMLVDESGTTGEITISNNGLCADVTLRGLSVVTLREVIRYLAENPAQKAVS